MSARPAAERPLWGSPAPAFRAGGGRRRRRRRRRVRVVVACWAAVALRGRRGRRAAALRWGALQPFSQEQLGAEEEESGLRLLVVVVVGCGWSGRAGCIRDSDRQGRRLAYLLAAAQADGLGGVEGGVVGEGAADDLAGSIMCVPKSVPAGTIAYPHPIPSPSHPHPIPSLLVRWLALKRRGQVEAGTSTTSACQLGSRFYVFLFWVFMGGARARAYGWVK